jgi:hypothetical protein
LDTSITSADDGNSDRFEGDATVGFLQPLRMNLLPGPPSSNSGQLEVNDKLEEGRETCRDHDRDVDGTQVIQLWSIAQYDRDAREEIRNKVNEPNDCRSTSCDDVP